MYVYSSYLQVRVFHDYFLDLTVVYECRKVTYATETLMNRICRYVSCIQSKGLMYECIMTLSTGEKSCTCCQRLTVFWSRNPGTIHSRDLIPLTGVA
jgi:hypothetical protein